MKDTTQQQRDKKCYFQTKVSSLGSGLTNVDVVREQATATAFYTWEETGPIPPLPRVVTRGSTNSIIQVLLFLLK